MNDYTIYIKDKVTGHISKKTVSSDDGISIEPVGKDAFFETDVIELVDMFNSSGYGRVYEDEQ